MAYMLLVVEKVGDRAARPEREGRTLYDRMLHFSEDLKQRGLLTMSQSLKTDAAGVRVTRFERYEVGAGLDKKQDNFVADVMAQVSAASKPTH